MKKNLGLTNMNGITEEEDTTCGLNDMNCVGEEEDTTSVRTRKMKRLAALQI